MRVGRFERQTRVTLSENSQERNRSRRTARSLATMHLNSCPGGGTYKPQTNGEKEQEPAHNPFFGNNAFE